MAEEQRNSAAKATGERAGPVFYTGMGITFFLVEAVVAGIFLNYLGYLPALVSEVAVPLLAYATIVAMIGGALINTFVRKPTPRDVPFQAWIGSFVLASLLVASLWFGIARAQNQPPVPPQWQLALTDALQHNSADSKWDTGVDSLGTNREFTDGGYQLATPANTVLDGIDNSPLDSFTDFFYQATMVIKAGTNDEGGGAGLVFRLDSSGSNYVYSFDSTGHWSLEVSRNETKSTPTTLASGPGPSPAFIRGYGHANVLGVKALGNTVTLYVNGQEVGSVANSVSSGGFIGFEVDGGTQVRADIVFSNLRVWVPPVPPNQ